MLILSIRPKRSMLLSRYLFIWLSATLCVACSPEPTTKESVKSSPHSVIEASAANFSAANFLRKTAKDLLPYQQRPIEDEVFYFVMPDRFNNGDTSNDHGSTTKPISAGGFDKTDKSMYHGGDIQGLEQKLPYLKELGISAIWLTPILRNRTIQEGGAGYHGYWVLDFTEIDPHLGSNQDLISFINAAHKDNIKVFFDIITNHTADVIKPEECYGKDGLQWLKAAGETCQYKSLAQVASGDSYTPVIPQGLENVKVPAWLNDPKYYHNQGETTYQGENSIYGDFAGLDDINTDDPEVVKGMIDIFQSIISEFKPDGFRIDTVKHVNMEFWIEFSPALVNHAASIGIPEFFMFGEVYSGDSKELSSYTTVGNMQSVLDFGLAFTLQHTLIDQQGTDKLGQLFANDSDYLDDNSNANQLLNFTGNHDMGRFAHMLTKSEHNYSEAEIIQRNLLAHAMVYFLRGVPIIYYGDEQGFIGKGGDQDSRQNMMPSLVASYNEDNVLATNKTTADDNFDLSHPFYKLFGQYSHIYYSYPALRNGVQQTLYQQDTPGVFAISRTLADDNKAHIVVFNTATSEQKIVLNVKGDRYNALYQSGEANIGHSMKLKNNKLSITVPALSFAIYQAQ